MLGWCKEGQDTKDLTVGDAKANYNCKTSKNGKIERCGLISTHKVVSFKY